MKQKKLFICCLFFIIVLLLASCGPIVVDNQIMKKYTIESISQCVSPCTQVMHIQYFFDVANCNTVNCVIQRVNVNRETYNLYKVGDIYE